MYFHVLKIFTHLNRYNRQYRLHFEYKSLHFIIKIEHYTVKPCYVFIPGPTYSLCQPFKILNMMMFVKIIEILTTSKSPFHLTVVWAFLLTKCRPSPLKKIRKLLFINPRVCLSPGGGCGCKGFDTGGYGMPLMPKVSSQIPSYFSRF